jgi:hypothetical protein
MDTPVFRAAPKAEGVATEAARRNRAELLQEPPPLDMRDRRDNLGKDASCLFPWVHEKLTRRPRRQRDIESVTRNPTRSSSPAHPLATNIILRVG